MGHPETFRAAIEKGVRDIADGKLRKLDKSEKQQLLAILRKRDDCPVGWKNIDPKKQRSLLVGLHKAIVKLVNPAKVKAASNRNHKRRRENGKQKATNDRNVKRRRENGKAKEYSAIYSARRSRARRKANAQAILENKDHHEDTWDEARLEKEATDIVEMIAEKCGVNGFVHVCGGAWPSKNLKKAMEAECFGKGRNRHAVFIDGGKFVRYRDVSAHVELLTPYSGTNCLNADELEKLVHQKLLSMGWPQHRRMFTRAGAGTCRGTRAVETPFPYYTGVLVCARSMKDIGIRLATKKDHAPKRKKRSSSSL